MKLPFSIEEFLHVFKEYNLSVWPMQMLFYVAAAICVWVIFKHNSASSKIVYAILSALWVWMGVVYHIFFFAEINAVAFGFGALFVVQGGIFIYYGYFKDDHDFDWHATSTRIVGIFLIVYSLVIYPVWGYAIGHQYPSSPTFGAPCPTTIFTFGILLFSSRPVAWTLVVIPLLWAVIGSSAAVVLGMREDFGLTAAALIILFIRIFERSRKHLSSAF